MAATLPASQAKRRLSVGDGRLGSLIAVPTTVADLSKLVPTYPNPISLGKG